MPSGGSSTSAAEDATNGCLLAEATVHIIPPTHPQMLDLGDTPKPPAKGGDAPFGNPLKPGGYDPSHLLQRRDVVMGPYYRN